MMRYIRCHEGDVALRYALELKQAEAYKQIAFRSCGKWSEMNSLIIYAPVQVWDALRLRSTERFRLGAGRRARVPPRLSTSVEKVPSIVSAVDA
jgi:hypothetical protein